MTLRQSITRLNSIKRDPKDDIEQESKLKYIKVQLKFLIIQNISSDLKGLK